jgi:hypothetical protein
MNRSRLLLAVPGATVLVLAGGSPAWAGGDGHEDEKTYAEVVSIADEASVEKDGDELTVEFTYKCEDGDDIKTHVALWQKETEAYYETKVKGDLECDGEEQTKEVTLEKKSDEEAENGDAKVKVAFHKDGEKLDKKVEDVTVEGAEDDGKEHDGKEHDGEKDNGH